MIAPTFFLKILGVLTRVVSFYDTGKILTAIFPSYVFQLLLDIFFYSYWNLSGNREDTIKALIQIVLILTIVLFLN